jgi:hypothetical protein
VVAKQRLGAANLSVSLTWRRDWGVFYQSEEGETRS